MNEATTQEFESYTKGVRLARRMRDNELPKRTIANLINGQCATVDAWCRECIARTPHGMDGCLVCKEWEDGNDD